MILPAPDAPFFIPTEASQFVFSFLKVCLLALDITMVMMMSLHVLYIFLINTSFPAVTRVLSPHVSHHITQRILDLN